MEQNVEQQVSMPCIGVATPADWRPCDDVIIDPAGSVVQQKTVWKIARSIVKTGSSVLRNLIKI